MPSSKARCQKCGGAHESGKCPAQTDLIGQVLDEKYRIIRVLGQGSMGTVFEAQHVRIGRRFAIKFLHPELTRSREIVSRFEREAQSAGALENENIAAAADFGHTSDGSPYIVMEFLQGEDVGSLLKRVGPLPLPRAADIVIQACHGLQAAHASGIVHRDLKPENLFVCRRASGADWVKILDFGVAKLRKPGVIGSSATRVGALIGTPVYMAPEHIRSARDVDERADIYALGVILYELLAGDIPHVATTYEQLLFKILNEQPRPLETLRPGLPSDLLDVVRRAMASEPHNRFAWVADMATALIPFTDAANRESQSQIPIHFEQPDQETTEIVGPRHAARRRQPGPLPVTVDLASADQESTEVVRPSGSFRHDSGPPPPLAVALTAGEDLGKYRLILRLAQGGMADIYLAGRKGAGDFIKLAVVKELRSAFGDEASSLNMFQDEARLAARLNHPNVVQTVEVASEGDRHFMVMEYLEGQPLYVILKRFANREGFTLATHARILCDALKGLHYAHDSKEFDGSALGIVHRDFTPHNIFVTYDGVVKVLDFGIAKAVDSHATRTGVIKGKLRYMPIEQAMGKKVDRRADIYAAGVMLWEAITRRRMWHGFTDVQILMKLMKETPPRPDEVNPSAPAELTQICMRALGRTPEERYDTAEHMRLEIEKWLSAERAKVPSADLLAPISEAFADERARIRGFIEEGLRPIRSASERPPRAPGQSSGRIPLEKPGSVRSIKIPRAAPAPSVETPKVPRSPAPIAARRSERAARAERGPVERAPVERAPVERRRAQTTSRTTVALIVLVAMVVTALAVYAMMVRSAHHARGSPWHTHWHKTMIG